MQIDKQQPFYDLDFGQYAVMELHRPSGIKFDLEWVLGEDSKVKEIQDSPYVLKYHSFKVLDVNGELINQINSLKNQIDKVGGKLKELTDHVLQNGESLTHFTMKEFLIVRKEDSNSVQRVIQELGFTYTKLSEEEATLIRIV